MTASNANKPMNWDDYEYGRSPRQGSIGSQTSRVRVGQPSPSGISDHLNIPRHGSVQSGNSPQSRRSSISLRLTSITQVGGVNSIENFARSWQRAAGYAELTPAPPSFVTSETDDTGEVRQPAEPERDPSQHRSLLRQQLESRGRSPGAARSDDEGDTGVHGDDLAEIRSDRLPVEPDDSIFSKALYIPSPLSNSYGGTYGSLSSRVNESSLRHAGRLYREQQIAGAQEPDQEREPLLVKRVEREDGTIVNVVVGQSTFPQTVFNSVNVLIGVGLLSLPLGMRYAGWLIGMGYLLFSAAITSYTASILAKCLDVDNSLVTFADLAYISFGSKARIATSILFSLEIMAACVALVILFSDSLDALIPGWGVVEWKIVCGIILIPLGFVPLRLLSFTSVLGILSCFGIVLIVFCDGIIKPQTPGSLREPATTQLFPRHWSTLPLSFGLLMSPWGGHSVFPNIYRDMRHPKKYGKAVKFTYCFTFLLDLSMAVAGWLMFGEGVREEVTSSVLLTKGYPAALSVVMVIFIGIIPLTKIPLNAHPIVSTLEIFCGLDARAMSASPGLVGMSGFNRGLLKCTLRILTVIIIVFIAIMFPSFERMMAFMGSALTFTICVILPLAFYLKIFGKELSWKERVLDWVLIIICSVLAAVGTVWAFLPKDKIGAC
ncbi:MAG: hypothetical protein M1830_002436 [Pleopsidium flavum]|nr:MAG: hypothetical protein M1830_002436 [Pleopsidium flavum]